MPSSSQPRRNSPGEVAALVFAVGSMLVLTGAAVWFWIVAPEPVPSHLDAAGRADDWSSKAGTLGILLPLGLGISMVFSIRWIWERVPAAFLNIPHRDYWLEAGNRDYHFDCLMEFMRITAGLVALLFASVLVIIMHEARSSMMPEWMTFVPTAVFLIATGFAVWRLLHRLRPPR
ncbi:DUF1648 domain-containing protein [Brevibacterium oceani]|uniref:DUF1648 domain-containing protein n=1 Tax=Brevibacterium oceani TaxID=358099 RepID=UPI0015E75D62|nr:DUF1648 domain-containing protein [Brevibacterium oceani]